jgi:hypothetical protein
VDAPPYVDLDDRIRNRILNEKWKPHTDILEPHSTTWLRIRFAYGRPGSPGRKLRT